MAKGHRGEGKKRATEGLVEMRGEVAGCDLGATEHWVCGPPTAERPENIERFGTTTPELQRLCRWLEEQGVGSVAMESTGLYWVAIYEVLEQAGFEVVLANAQQLKNVPGRPKSDRLDCQWIRRLHSCGLLRGSFRPHEKICELRALNRQRENFVGQRMQAVQWMQKALDQMNVQIHRAVTDITGTTGMAILRAILGGERDPKVLAKLRDHRCKNSEAQIAAHLSGNWRTEHLFNLRMAFEQHEQLERVLERYDREIERCLRSLSLPDLAAQSAPPHPNAQKQKDMGRRGELERRDLLYRFSRYDLTRIDGIATAVASTILFEVGPDLSAFPTEKHFCSWIGRAPRTAITGGKPLRKKKKRAMAATRIATALSQAASSLKNSPTALGAYFRKICRRKGFTIAVFSTARKLASLVYRLLRYGQDYVDRGAEAYELRLRSHRIQRLSTTARELGYSLIPFQPGTVTPAAVSN